jgi:hypothetical protein
MKLAFCFTGMCKNYDMLYENNKEKLFDPLSKVYDIDFYLSSSKSNMFINPRIHENCEIKWDSILKYFDFKNTIILEEKDEELIKIHDFVDLLASQFELQMCPPDADDFTKKNCTYGAIKYLYHLYLLKTIVEPSDKYIIARQDIYYRDKINVDLVSNSKEDALIPLCHEAGSNFKTIMAGNTWTTDRFAILNKKSFDVYINRYKTIIEKPERYITEDYLTRHLNSHNISVDVFDEFDYFPVRSYTNIKNEIIVNKNRKIWSADKNKYI